MNAPIAVALRDIGGFRLKQTYPMLQVEVFDATARRFTPVVLREN
jgi:hypothetical protein